MTRPPPSQPLRALGAIVGAYLLGRGAWLLIDRIPTSASVPAADPVQIAQKTELPSVAARPAGSPATTARPALVSIARPDRHARSTLAVASPAAPPSGLPPPVARGPKPPPITAARGAHRLVSLGPLHSTGPRISGSAWLLLRPPGASPLAPAGTLGGGQFGTRLYLPLAGRELALTGRLSAPLRGPGAEAAFGVALRRGSAGLIVERRIALDSGGRNDFGVTAFADLAPIAIAPRLDISGYAQGGLVGGDGFADAALRLDRRFASVGRVRLATGVALGASAQPRLSRVDIGPHLTARLPIGGADARLSAEWRFRVAGNAAPASGPALTLSTDF